MDQSRLKRLNQILADQLGSNSQGPLYKWAWTRDLRIGIQTAFRRYEHVPQVAEDRWALAMWQAPPSEELFKMTFGTEMAYPRSGWYHVCDTPVDRLLEEGFEPSERFTYYIIHLTKKQRAMSMRDIRRTIEDNRAARDVEKDKHVGDYLDDVVTAFGNLPGKRGGSVSFGGI